ncbi:MAG: glycerophosphodiester phosphodiesterase family protein [Muribaculaceae bacterium]|nr:glycerophosphodiester phosphodiesterase family protein [Muribaculaceae bacterium]
MRSLILFFFIIISNIVLAQTRCDTLMHQLRDVDSSKIFTVSHRGDWRNAPENSLQAIQNCIDMGVDMVEIDLKKTKDGHLILMHDKLIDRTTTGKGHPNDYTLDEIKQFRLRNGAGHRTEHIVPTLEEAMTLAKGKILVNIDKGYDYFDDVYEILEKTGTINQCIIKASKSYKTVMDEKPVALEKMLFMPVVRLTDKDACKIVEEYQENYSPLMFELVFDNDGPEVIGLIDRIKNSSAKIFINSLWSELCGGHHDDRAVEKNEMEQSWGWIIKRGASLIQTDRPAQLLKYLKDKGLHE